MIDSSLSETEVRTGQDWGFKFRQFVDFVRDGKLFTEYYHAKPIPLDEAHKLAEKRRLGKLDSKSAELLDEYFRAQHYLREKQELDKQKVTPKVLYIASGFDGLPGSVFGQENTIMTSLDPDYFNKYITQLKGTQKAEKVVASFYENPFASGAINTLVVNGFEVFDGQAMAAYNPSLNQGMASEQVLRKFWTEMRRLATPGAALITTEFQKEGQFASSPAIPPEAKKILEETGWKIKEQSYMEESYCKLIATDPKT